MDRLPPLPEPDLFDVTDDSFRGHSDDQLRAYAEEAVRLERAAQETDRDWSKAQDWKGMDGATALLLINRHADGWGDTRAMMEAWLAANSEEASEGQG